MSNKDRNIIVAIAIIGSFLCALCQTILTTALPNIMKDFSINANIGQWLTTMYLLVLGIIIPVTAYLVNRFTTRQLYLTAMSFFTVGCLLAILSPNIYVMILARVIQAVGAGILTQLVQIIILRLFPIERRGAAMGIMGFTIGFAPAIGPTFAGMAIDRFGWRSMFYFLGAVAVLDILVAIKILKNIGETSQNKIDRFSVLFSSLGFGGILIGVSEQGSYGFSNPITFIPLIVGITFLILFVKRQLNLEKPLLELRVFKNRDFTIATIVISLAYAAFMGAPIIVSMYIQNVRSLTAETTGLIMLPGSLLLAFLSPVSGRILDKYGPRLLAITGMVSISLGTFFFSFISLNSSLTHIAIFYALRLFGLACFLTPLTTWGINSLDVSYISDGSAINNTFRQTSGAIGAAVLVTVMTSTTKNSDTQDSIQALIVGMNSSFRVATIMLIVGLIGILLFVKSNKKSEKSQDLEIEESLS